jgi:LPS O-antigen subunit length determinant protein (WzzB/FepE family)
MTPTITSELMHEVKHLATKLDIAHAHGTSKAVVNARVEAVTKLDQLNRLYGSDAVQLAIAAVPETDLAGL